MESSKSDKQCTLETNPGQSQDTIGSTDMSKSCFAAETNDTDQSLSRSSKSILQRQKRKHVKKRVVKNKPSKKPSPYTPEVVEMMLSCYLGAMSENHLKRIQSAFCRLFKRGIVFDQATVLMQSAKENEDDWDPNNLMQRKVWGLVTGYRGDLYSPPIAAMRGDRTGLPWNYGEVVVVALTRQHSSPDAFWPSSTKPTGGHLKYLSLLLKRSQKDVAKKFSIYTQGMVF